MMNKFLIKEIFKIHGGVSGLTEKVIYENQAENEEDNISVFSSATEETFFLPKVDRNTKINEKEIKIFSKEKKYIIVARNGKAGLMGIIENLDFTINDHAYIFEIKKNFIGKIDLKYFILKYQKTFLDFVTSKDSNGTFSKEIAENYIIELIDIEIQKDTINSYTRQTLLQNSIRKQIKKIEKQMKKSVSALSNKKDFLLSELFYIATGMPIRQKQAYANGGDIPIISSKTTDNGVIFYADEDFLNQEGNIYDELGVSWSIDGNAGKLFLQNGKFFITNHAGVIIPRKYFQDKINLNWFILIAQYKFYSFVVAKNGQGKLGAEQVSNISIEIPIKEDGEIDKEQQDVIYTEYKRLLDIKGKLQAILEKYST